MSGATLYSLNVQCDKCGAPPRLRGTDFLVSRLAQAHPDAVVVTYQCHWQWPDGRRCRNRYEVRVRHFTKVS